MVKLHNVRHFREQAILTQDELAEKAGVSRVTVVRLEAGEDARPATIRKVAAALGIEPRDLVEPIEADQGKEAA